MTQEHDGSGTLRNLPVTTMPLMAHEEHLSEHGTWIAAHEFARKSVLVVENNAMVLGGHVEVLRQGTVGDEASTLLYVDHMPRPIEVRGQQARIQTSCRSRVPGEEL